MAEQTNEGLAGGSPAGAQQTTPATGAAGTAETAGEQAQATDSGKPGFQDWYNTQPAEIKTLIDEHVVGLKTVLAEQKQRRADAMQQLKEAMTNLEKKDRGNEETRATLVKLQQDYQLEAQRMSFYEAASEAGIRRLKLAWIAAQDCGAFDPKGNVDLDKLRQVFPELFPKARPAAADAGAGAQSQTQFSMNTLIREAAGHRIG